MLQTAGIDAPPVDERAIRALCIVELEAMVDEPVAEFAGDEFLELLDVERSEFDHPAAPQIDQMVVVVVRHGLVARTPVAEVVPLVTERCVVQLDAERALSRRVHWHRVMASACEQCGRNRLPRLGEVAGVADWLAAASSGARLVLSPVAEAALSDLPRPQGAVTLLIGPEGGLAPAELALAAHRGFTPLRLGPRILRTETAVVAALAAIQACWGDLADR